MFTIKKIQHPLDISNIEDLLSTYGYRWLHNAPKEVEELVFVLPGAEDQTEQEVMDFLIGEGFDVEVEAI